MVFPTFPKPRDFVDDLDDLARNITGDSWRLDRANAESVEKFGTFVAAESVKQDQQTGAEPGSSFQNLFSEQNNLPPFDLAQAQAAAEARIADPREQQPTFAGGVPERPSKSLIGTFLEETPLGSGLAGLGMGALEALEQQVYGVGGAQAMARQHLQQEQPSRNLIDTFLKETPIGKGMLGLGRAAFPIRETPYDVAFKEARDSGMSMTDAFEVAREFQALIPIGDEQTGRHGVSGFLEGVGSALRGDLGITGGERRPLFELGTADLAAEVFNPINVAFGEAKLLTGPLRAAEVAAREAAEAGVRRARDIVPTGQQLTDVAGRILPERKVFAAVDDVGAGKPKLIEFSQELEKRLKNEPLQQFDDQFPNARQDRVAKQIGRELTPEITAAQTGQPFDAVLFRGFGRTEEGAVFDPRGFAGNVVGDGTYTTPSADFAANFGSEIEELRISLRNPLVIKTDAEFAQITREAGLRSFAPTSADEAASLRRVVEGRGHDGLIVVVPDTELTGKRLIEVFGSDTVVDFAGVRPDVTAARGIPEAAAPVARGAPTEGQATLEGGVVPAVTEQDIIDRRTVQSGFDLTTTGEDAPLRQVGAAPIDEPAAPVARGVGRISRIVDDAEPGKYPALSELYDSAFRDDAAGIADELGLDTVTGKDVEDFRNDLLRQVQNSNLPDEITVYRGGEIYEGATTLPVSLNRGVAVRSGGRNAGPVQEFKIRKSDVLADVRNNPSFAEEELLVRPEALRSAAPVRPPTAPVARRAVEAADVGDETYIAIQQRKEARAASSGKTYEEQLYLANRQRSLDIENVELAGGVRPQDLPPIEESLPVQRAVDDVPVTAPTTARRAVPPEDAAAAARGRAIGEFDEAQEAADANRQQMIEFLTDRTENPIVDWTNVLPPGRNFFPEEGLTPRQAIRLSGRWDVLPRTGTRSKGLTKAQKRDLAAGKPIELADSGRGGRFAPYTEKEIRDAAQRAWPTFYDGRPGSLIPTEAIDELDSEIVRLNPQRYGEESREGNAIQKVMADIQEAQAAKNELRGIRDREITRAERRAAPAIEEPEAPPVVERRPLSQTAQRGIEEQRSRDIINVETDVAPSQLPELNLDASLPAGLSKSTPKFGRQFLEWESDVDKALYIVGNPRTKSKAHDKFMDFLREQGFTDAEIRIEGAAMRGKVKGIASGAGNDVFVPQQDLPRQITRTVDEIQAAPETASPAEARYAHTQKVAPGGPPKEPPKRANQQPEVDPSDFLRDAVESQIPGERLDIRMLINHDAAITTSQIDARADVRVGNDLLKEIGWGTRRANTRVPRLETADIAEMDELYAALHGEGPVPEKFREAYELARLQTDMTEAMKLDFDPEMARVEDYMFRGWKPSQRIVDAGTTGTGGIAHAPDSTKARVGSTYRQMRGLDPYDDGKFITEPFEPMFWNPFEQIAYDQMQNVRYQQQMVLIEALKKEELVKPAAGIGNTTEGWRTPQIGLAFEGKPFAAERPTSDGPIVMWARRWIVPDEIANRLETMYGKKPDMGKISVDETVHVNFPIAKLAVRKISPKRMTVIGPDGKVIIRPRGSFSIQKFVDWMVFVPKRAGLLVSFFQDIDFATRLGIGMTQSVLTQLATGRPIAALKTLGHFPLDLADIPRARFSRVRKEALQDLLLSKERIIPNRNVSFYDLSKRGLSIEDQTIFPTDLDAIAREVADETGLVGKVKGLGSQLRNLETDFRSGLFNGTYPSAITNDIKHNLAVTLDIMYPGISDEQFAARLAKMANTRFSTIPEVASVVQNRLIRATLKRVLFSLNENEGLIRQFTGALKGPSKKFWATHFLSSIVFLTATANIISFISTGKGLEGKQYSPIWKTEHGPFPYGYNSEFAAPVIPGVARRALPAMLDLVGQMDTVFRMLSPKDFITGRLSRPLRAISNQWNGSDFYDEPSNDFGPGGIADSAFQLIYDLFAPFGIGPLIAGATRRAFPETEGLIPLGESRLGIRGEGIQAGGANLRALSNERLKELLNESTDPELMARINAELEERTREWQIRNITELSNTDLVLFIENPEISASTKANAEEELRARQERYKKFPGADTSSRFRDAINRRVQEESELQKK